MKILINPDNLIPTEEWQRFYKVRAIIENAKGQFVISEEGGKYIFPGGKRKNTETNMQAIQRELREETGISVSESELTEVLEIETIYKDFYDYRSNSIKPRHTTTVYYYVKTSENINIDNMELTLGEVKENFKVAFVEGKQLIDLLLKSHSLGTNGNFFDEENRIVVNHLLKDMVEKQNNN